MPRKMGVSSNFCPFNFKQELGIIFMVNIISVMAAHSAFFHYDFISVLNLPKETVQCRYNVRTLRMD